MQIATAATNHNTRHPLITGSWATTMHRLSGGRFTLGIGRGVAAMYAAFGIPSVTTAQMEDFAQVMRRLWNGEVIFNHDGPIGKYQVLFLDPDFNEDIRLAHRGLRPEDSRTRRAGVRRRHPAHLLHAGNAAAVRQDREGRRREGGPRPRQRAGVVVLRHRRRPPARGAAAEEDRRPAGHLPAGLRRPAGHHQRLGSRCAATLPRGLRRAPRYPAASTTRPPPSRSSTSRR